MPSATSQTRAALAGLVQRSSQSPKLAVVVSGSAETGAAGGVCAATAGERTGAGRPAGAGDRRANRLRLRAGRSRTDECRQDQYGAGTVHGCATATSTAQVHLSSLRGKQRQDRAVAPVSAGAAPLSSVDATACAVSTENHGLTVRPLRPG